MGVDGGVEKWLSRQAHNLKFRWFESNLRQFVKLAGAAKINLVKRVGVVV